MLASFGYAATDRARAVDVSSCNDRAIA